MLFRKTYILATFMAITLILVIIPPVSPIGYISNTIEDSSINLGETEYWALLIAVGEYADNPQEDRPYMLKSVDDLQNILLQSKIWSEDHIKVIKGKNATLLNIIKGFKWLDRKEDANDISLVTIDTHGGPGSRDKFPKDEKDEMDEYLTGYYGFALNYDALSDDLLNYYLNRLESKGTAVIVNSCHSGGFNDPPGKNLFRKKGRVVLMSSSEDEGSVSGLFSPYVLDALRGFGDLNNDNIISAEEIFRYAYPRVKKHYQNPTIYDDYDGELPLLELSEEQKENIKNREKRNNNVKSLFINNFNDSNKTIIHGFIKDNETNDPINNANVTIYWYNDSSFYKTNYTQTDLTGFYSFNVSAEKFILWVSIDGYYYKSSNWINTGENKSIWVNLSLTKINEISNICGYIKDNNTNNPINNTNISINWMDDKGNFYMNYTLSDTLGFYIMNVSSGKNFVYAKANGYYNFYTDPINISENETKWVNISLNPIPIKNSIVKGYITDFTTKKPIEDVNVGLRWIDDQDNNEYNDTYSDSQGFYSFNVAKGSIYMSYNKENYYYENIDWFNIDENEVVWINITLNSSSYDYKICGFVKNSVDSSPIENASLDIHWRDIFGHPYDSQNSSNDQGFYSVNIKAGRITSFEVNAEGFFPYDSDKDIIIQDDYLLWINISMDPLPDENSVVYGYVIDSETKEPIKNATIKMTWENSINSDVNFRNYTKSDDLGFYYLNIPAGNICIFAEASNYFDIDISKIYKVGENEILWVNLSFDLKPLKNAIVCGFIRDLETRESITHTSIHVGWYDFDYDHQDYNSTFTDSTGFYSINISAGKIYVKASKKGYLYEYSKLTTINKNDTLWVNLSMYKEPPEKSILCGYITDSGTNEPIQNASLLVEWIGCNWHHKINWTIKTNEEGYYYINVSAGELYFRSCSGDYQRKSFSRHDIGENETLWFNITLEKSKIDVYLYRPVKAIYLKNELRLPFFKPVILGDFEIKFIIWNCDEIENLKIYIDNELKLNLTDIPNDLFYSYMWKKEKTRVFGHKHTIKVIATDKNGFTDCETVNVLKFF